MSSACRDPGVPSPVRTDSTSTARTVSPVTASVPPVLVPSPPRPCVYSSGSGLAFVYLFLAITHANPLDRYFSGCYSENLSPVNHACILIESQASASHPHEQSEYPSDISFSFQRFDAFGKWECVVFSPKDCKEKAQVLNYNS